MWTKTELTLEETQQGVSDEVLVSIEGVKNEKEKVKLKGEKKEALLTPRTSDAYAGNPIKEILFNLNLPDHRSVLMEPEVNPTKPGRMTKPYSSTIFIANYFITGSCKDEMEIPYSGKVKFITVCSYLIDKYKDMMKAQVHVTQVFGYSDTQKCLP
ncbi:hypothetical protein Tco_0528134 [Tanacetum coccineum]